jgi:hypothetical protein
MVGRVVVRVSRVSRVVALLVLGNVVVVPTFRFGEGPVFMCILPVPVTVLTKITGLQLKMGE